MFRRWLFVASLAAALGVLSSANRAANAEPKAEAAADEADPQAGLFQVPEGEDVEALAKFIARLKKFRPTTRAEALELRSKGGPAILAAAEKILTLEKDTKSPAYIAAKRILLQQKSQALTNEGSAEERLEMLKEIVAFLKTSDKSVDDARLAQSYAIGLEYAPDTETAAVAYEQLGELLKTSDNEDVAKVGQMLLGAHKRLNLVGQPLVLKGTTLDGKPFDLKSLKGKVVLVDFWATWCGPCRAEHPNIERNYKAYHDAGFEVVGVSIDQDRSALEEYIAEHKTPWITLHEKDAMGENQATTDYGIFGIPNMMLVDKEGNVVSTRARGQELGKLLEGLLGPPAEAEKE